MVIVRAPKRRKETAGKLVSPPLAQLRNMPGSVPFRLVLDFFHTRRILFCYLRSTYLPSPFSLPLQIAPGWTERRSSRTILLGDLLWFLLCCCVCGIDGSGQLSRFGIKRRQQIGGRIPRLGVEE